MQTQGAGLTIEAGRYPGMRPLDSNQIITAPRTRGPRTVNRTLQNIQNGAQALRINICLR